MIAWGAARKNGRRARQLTHIERAMSIFMISFDPP